MTAECSSAWFQIDGYLSTRCVSSINHETDNFMRDELYFVTLQTGEAVEINLSDLYINGNDDSPAMVWIGLQGNVHHVFHLHPKHWTIAHEYR